MSGLWGILIYVGVDVLSNMLEKSEEGGGDVGEMVKRGGIGGFLYLEVLDASFSFDGVIGAFAITNDVVIIMLGLAIGAMFVRSLTVYLVEKGTLDEFVYLEHGAHYAIGILALIMLASMKFHVPEMVTGLAGVAFIGASVWSSIRYRKKQEALGVDRKSWHTSNDAADRGHGHPAHIQGTATTPRRMNEYELRGTQSRIPGVQPKQGEPSWQSVCKKAVTSTCRKKRRAWSSLKRRPGLGRARHRRRRRSTWTASCSC